MPKLIASNRLESQRRPSRHYLIALKEMRACTAWGAQNQGCRSALSRHRHAQAAAAQVRYTFDFEFVFDHCICRNVFLLPHFSQPQSLSYAAENEFPVHSLRRSVRGCVYEFRALDLDSNLMKESPVPFVLRYNLHSREQTETKDHTYNKW